MFAPARFRRSLLAFCWLIPAACASLLAAEREVNLPGVYQGHAPAADAAKRVFTLNLGPDGTALLTTVFIGKGDATQRGRWTRSGSQVVITFDAIGPNRPPRPLTFRHRDHELSPVHWDPNEWGRNGPPVLHRSREAQGGL
jgi:hypothetical protein